jgi:hypothetical protein
VQHRTGGPLFCRDVLIGRGSQDSRYPRRRDIGNTLRFHHRVVTASPSVAICKCPGRRFHVEMIPSTHQHAPVGLLPPAHRTFLPHQIQIPTARSSMTNKRVATKRPRKATSPNRSDALPGNRSHTLAESEAQPPGSSRSSKRKRDTGDSGNIGLSYMFQYANTSRLLDQAEEQPSKRIRSPGSSGQLGTWAKILLLVYYSTLDSHCFPFSVPTKPKRQADPRNVGREEFDHWSACSRCCCSRVLSSTLTGKPSTRTLKCIRCIARSG